MEERCPSANNFTDLDRGYCVAKNLVSPEEVNGLVRAIPPVSDGAAGSRDLYTLPWMRTFATASAMADVAREVLGEDTRAVRILYFDKQAGANWKLPYHQDLTIAVADRFEMEGYAPWSEKQGIIHVQPPRATLERMIAVRLHLDDCAASNGALRVLPGTI